jgi:hypothetical protein
MVANSNSENSVFKSILKSLPNFLKNRMNQLALAIPAAVVLTLVLIPRKMEKGKALMRGMELNAPFWIFLLLTLTTLFAMVKVAPLIKKYLKGKGLKPASLALALAFAIFTTWLASSQIEGRHRVQSDESIFLATAQNLFHHQIAGACDEGVFDGGDLTCLNKAANFKAKIQAWLYVMGMPFFGKDLYWIFGAQLVLLFLSVLAVWLAVILWSRSSVLAFITTALLFMQPTILFQFRATSVEPLYVFLSAMCFILLHWSLESKNIWVILLYSTFLAAFSQTRQETVFAIFAFSIAAFPAILRSKGPAFLIYCLSLTFFTLPILFTIASYQGYGFQGGEFSAHGHFLEHIKINWNVMTNTPRDGHGLLANPFLPYFTYLAVAGLGYMVLYSLLYLMNAFSAIDLKNKIQSTLPAWLLFGLLYHLQSYMIFENVSGDFTIQINQRYSLVILPSMALVGAILIRDLLSLIPWKHLFSEKKKNASEKEEFGHPAAALVLSLLIILIFSAMTFKEKKSLNANIMYKRNHLTMEQAAILDWQERNPGEKFFVYARPWHFVGYGHSAYYYNRFRRLSEDKVQKLLTRYNGEIYYIRGMDCWNSKTYHKKAVESRKPKACDDFEKKFDLKKVHSQRVTGSYPLYIYKVLGPKSYDTKKALQPGVLHYYAADSSLVYSYRMESKSEDLKTLRIYLNDSLIQKIPFENGKGSMDTLKPFLLKPGYASLRFDVHGKGRAPLIRKYKTVFFPLNGAKALVDYPITSSIQSWGNLSKNKSINGNPINARGIEYPFGLGTHANSQIRYDLKGEFSALRTAIALDDEEPNSDGIQFRIMGDGKELYKSPTMKAGHLEWVEVPLTGVNTLELLVDSLGNKNYDHADWIFPVLIQKPAE